MVDRAGRLVLPKPIRDRLGLSGGSELELSIAGESILLEPVRNDSNLVWKDGVLVHTGVPTRDLASFDAVRSDREARLRRVAGRDALEADRARLL